METQLGTIEAGKQANLTVVEGKGYFDPEAKVQLIELPNPPSSVFGFLGNLLGLHAQDRGVTLTDLPVVKELLRGIPASILVDPSAAQARLPYDLTWE